MSHHHKNREECCEEKKSCGCSSSGCCKSCKCGCHENKSCGCSSSGCCKSCKCGCHEKSDDKGSCKESSCHSGECESSCKEFAGQLLEMADQAWLDVLHSKIADEVERHCGSQLDEIAAVVARANKAKWHHKMEAKKGCSEYSAALAHIFHKDS